MLKKKKKNKTKLVGFELGPPEQKENALPTALNRPVLDRRVESVYKQNKAARDSVTNRAFSGLSGDYL